VPTPWTAPLGIRFCVHRSQVDLRWRELRIKLAQFVERRPGIDQICNVVHRNARSPNDGCATQYLRVFGDQFLCLPQLVQAAIHVVPDRGQQNLHRPGFFELALTKLAPGVIVCKRVSHRFDARTRSQHVFRLEVEGDPEASILANGAILRSFIEHLRQNPFIDHPVDLGNGDACRNGCLTGCQIFDSGFH